MDAIRRYAKPVLRRPRALLAFEGWNDACDAASGAAAYLLGQLDAADPFAIIDPEEFFDFQARRPTVEIDEGGTRSLTWPTTRFYAIPLTAEDRDLVVVLGEEPSHRWKTFARLVTQLLCEVDVEEAVLLGAFIGKVPHTRAVPIIGSATDRDLVLAHGLPTSSYEGPTGIVGVLLEACREVGMPAISLWAATPHYLAANPNPKAMLALLDAAADVMHFGFDRSELTTIVSEFTERVEAAVRNSGEFAEYVSELEDDESPEAAEGSAAARIDPALTHELVDEIEDFLRDQG
jgi:proteasome assembly chaperone (PAC2) family protein